MVKPAIKARIAWIPIIALAVSCASVAIGIVHYNNTRIDGMNVKSEITAKYNFSKNTIGFASVDIKPTRGWLDYRGRQTKGNSKCQYQLTFRTVNGNGKWVTARSLGSNGRYSHNNKWDKAKCMTNPNGYLNYNTRLHKTDGKKVASAVEVEYFVV